MGKIRKTSRVQGGARSFYCALVTSTFGPFIPEQDREKAQLALWDKVQAQVAAWPSDTPCDHIIIQTKIILHDLFGDQAMITPPKKVPPPPDYSAQIAEYQKILAINTRAAELWLKDQPGEVQKALMPATPEATQIDLGFALNTNQVALKELQVICQNMGLPCKQVVKANVGHIADMWQKAPNTSMYHGQIKIEDALYLLVGMWEYRDSEGVIYSGGCTILPRMNPNATIREHTDVVWSPNGKTEAISRHIDVCGVTGDLQMYIIPITDALVESHKQILFWANNSNTKAEQKWVFDITKQGLLFRPIASLPILAG